MTPTQTSLFDFDDAPGQAKPANEPAPKSKKVKETIPVIAVPSNIYAREEAPVAIPIDLTEVIGVVPVNKPVAIGKTKSTRGRKSIKEMSASVHLVNVPADEILFQKRYYSMGKVAEMFGVNQSLIRLWENEFDVLKPMKNGKGDRHFRPEDVKNIQLIHHLLREKKYTMQGAKDFFKNNKKSDERFGMIESLKKIKSFLLELKANL